jgi:hypothetical protein
MTSNKAANKHGIQRRPKLRHALCKNSTKEAVAVDLKRFNKCWFSNLTSNKRGSKELCSVPRILSAIDLAVAFAAHVSFHIGDVVELGGVAVFLHVWAFVLRHGGDEVLDDFVGDERVAEVELCDIWLVVC